MWGAYFCVGAYKRDVVVVIKMVPIFMGAYYSDFMIPLLIVLYLYVTQSRLLLGFLLNTSLDKIIKAHIKNFGFHPLLYIIHQICEKFTV